jgi:Asp-tRNA(Asn)/Glu-tRNA(Gln) amidotransferase A subunit family amidase
MGDSFKEDHILKVGHTYEQTTDWHSRQPAC